MRTGLLILAYFLWIIASVQQLWSQSDEECKEQVRRAYDKLNAYGQLPEEGTMCHLDYSQQTFMRDSSKYNNSTVAIRMKASMTKAWYTNGDMELFQDTVSSIVIFRSRNTVYLRDSDFRSPEGKKQMLQQLTQNNDTLLMTASVEGCIEIEQAGSPVRQVTMRAADKVGKSTTIERLVYTIDLRNEVLKSIRTEFSGSSAIVATVVEFYDAGCGEREQPFRDDVYSRFLTDDGKLHEPYSSYKLIDVRSKKDR